MAAEIVDLSVTADIIEPDGRSLRNSDRTFNSKLDAPRTRQNGVPNHCGRRASCGSYHHGGKPNNGQNILSNAIGGSNSPSHGGVNPRRYSTGNPNLPNSGDNISPNYLRASTGSCHDFCKYGRKHASEVKPWRSIQKSVVSSPSDKQNAIESGVSAKGNMAKPKPSVFRKHSLGLINLEVSSSQEVEIILKGLSPEKVDTSTNEVSLEKVETSTEEVLSKKVEATSTTKEVLSVKVETSTKEGLLEKIEANSTTKEVSLKKVETSTKEVLTEKVEANSTTKEMLSVKVETSTKEVLSKKIEANSTTKKVETSTKKVLSEKVEATSTKEASSNEKNYKFSGKKHTPIKPKSMATKSPSSNDISGGLSGGGNSQGKFRKNPGTLKAAVKKALASPAASKGPNSARSSVKRIEKNTGTFKAALKKVLAPPVDLKSSNNGRNKGVKIGKKMGSLKAAIKEVPVLPAASRSLKPPSNGFITSNVGKHGGQNRVSLTDQNRIRTVGLEQPNSENVSDKTLHVIKVESDNHVMESAENGSIIHSPLSPLLPSPKASSLPINSPELSSDEEPVEESTQYTVSEADEAGDSISESSEAVNMHDAESAGGNWKRLPKKAEGNPPEDKDGQPVKLKFRRGKVVDLQSENKGPRRLRFRRGRVVGENQDGRTVRRQNFRKRAADKITNHPNSDSEKVVLRHQDVEGKKDAQGLFNNVIEETASKLVESRKSKVKALVGAFETVISLQESKPSAQTVS